MKWEIPCLSALSLISNRRAAVHLSLHRHQCSLVYTLLSTDITTANWLEPTHSAQHSSQEEKHILLYILKMASNDVHHAYFKLESAKENKKELALHICANIVWVGYDRLILSLSLSACLQMCIISPYKKTSQKQHFVLGDTSNATMDSDVADHISKRLWGVFHGSL